MNRKFDPTNAVIKRCMKGMELEDSGDTEGALTMFHQAWEEAVDDYERFIAAYHIARLQKESEDKVEWMKTSLQCALKVDDENVKSAYTTLYANLASCYEELGDVELSKKYDERSKASMGQPSDNGPFYHGTKADLKIGDLLTPGGLSNYKSDLIMNHIYFTANLNGAELAAIVASGEGRSRVYRIEPTGKFENDPNVTDKKFPGNLTRSYRSKVPVRIVGEEEGWAKMTENERSEWRNKIAKNKGEIIN